MFLTHWSANPQVNLTLESFLRMSVDLFGERLVSVILYGAILYDDLAPGYGDLDFVAVVEGDLSGEVCQQLIGLREPLKSGEYGALGKMIEGVFLPRWMLDPACQGGAFWWGTSGERLWQDNQLGWLTLHQIRKDGMVIWGEDIRDEIPEVTREQLLQDIHVTCQSLEEHGKGGNLHSVDWLLMAARALLFLREGRYCSKSEAAEWGFEHAEGEWRKHLPRAKQLRLNPDLADSCDWKAWLEALTGPIKEAGEELRRELSPGMRYVQ